MSSKLHLPGSNVRLDSYAVLLVFGSLETSMLIITATIPTLPPLFQKQVTKDSSPYLLRETPSTSYRRSPSNHHTAQARESQVCEYIKEPGKSSTGTPNITPTTDQFQRSYDDEVFLKPFGSNGRHTGVNVAWWLFHYEVMLKPFHNHGTLMHSFPMFENDLTSYAEMTWRLHVRRYAFITSIKCINRLLEVMDLLIHAIMIMNASWNGTTLVTILLVENLGSWIH